MKERTLRITRAVLCRVGLARLAGLALLALGIFILTVSIIYTSSVLGFAGLGLAFWGGLLFYITPSQHVPLEFLSALVTPALTNIEKMMKTYNLKERGIYLPPKYSESGLVFIPAEGGRTLPKPDKLHEERLHQEPSKGIFLTPPGIALANLFEKTLATPFTEIGLNYIRENLPKLLIEDLQIAEDIGLQIKDNTITLKITSHIFTQICQEMRKLRKTHKAIGCPLSSSIAVMLTRAIRKPVVIEENSMSEDGKIVEVRFQIIEE